LAGAGRTDFFDYSTFSPLYTNPAEAGDIRLEGRSELQYNSEKAHDLVNAAEQCLIRRGQPGDKGGNSVALELNRAAILENFMDDEELLFETIDLFLDRVSARMTALKKAVADKNPDVFMPEAHTLKGMIGNFSTAGAFEAAKKLEMKGREKVTAGIDEDFQALENELELLAAALKAWRSG